MSSQENPAFNFDHTDENSEGRNEELNQAKIEYQNRVTGSKLGKAERKACLEWSYRSDVTMKQLREALDHFGTAEADSVRLLALYEHKLDDFVARGFFSKRPERKQAYLEWFRDLPYEDPSAPIDKKRALLKSDLDISKEMNVDGTVVKVDRMELAESFSKLPRVVRERLQSQYDDNGFKENIVMVFRALKQHEALKTRFLKIPEEVQLTYRESFKEMDFPQREIFLIQAEMALKEQTEAKIKETKGAEGKEGGAEQKNAKEQAVANKLDAAGVYVPPSTHGKAAEQEKKAGLGERAKQFVLGLLRKLSLSTSGGDHAAEAIETLAISEEVALRRKRAEIQNKTRTAKELSKSEDEAGRDRNPFAHTVQLQLNELRHDRTARHHLKRKLKPQLDDTNAVATDIILKNESGQELTTDEFRNTQLRQQRMKVREVLIHEAALSAEPLDTSTLREAVAGITDQELKIHTKETIRKSA